MNNEISPAELFACSKDVIHFCKYITVHHPIKGTIPFVPRPSQIVMLRSYQDNQRTVVMSGRQRGKTLISAIFILWYSIFHSDQTVYIGSNTLRMSSDILHIIRSMHIQLPEAFRQSIDVNNKHELKFNNGTKIRAGAVTEASGRGYTINLMYLDEAAFIDPIRLEGFWISVAPTIATGGKVMITSTPNERGELFHTIWEQAINRMNGQKPIFNPVFLGLTEQPTSTGIQPYGEYARALDRG